MERNLVEARRSTSTMPSNSTNGSLRIEIAGPELDSRGKHYGVGQAHCSADGASQLVEKRYEGWCVGTVDSGVFHYAAEGGETLAVPGAILFGNAGEAFTCRHVGPEGNRRSVIAVGHGLMTEAADALGLEDGAFKVAAIPPGPGSAALYGAIRHLTRSRQVLEITLMELLAATLSIGRKSRKWKCSGRDVTRVLEIVKLLEADYAQPHELQELAALAKFSRFHFIRVFRQVTGVSPNQFLIGVRLRVAAERLQITSQPITSVALETGFNDISHFNRSFRRAFGMSPRQWRNAS